MVLCDGWRWLVYQVISKGTWFKGTHKPLDESTLNELFIDYLSFSYWKIANTKWSLAFFHLFFGGHPKVKKCDNRETERRVPIGSLSQHDRSGLSLWNGRWGGQPPTHKPHVHWWHKSVRQFAIVAAKNCHHWVK
jgi:hypothetical protein